MNWQVLFPSIPLALTVLFGFFFEIIASPKASRKFLYYLFALACLGGIYWVTHQSAPVLAAPLRTNSFLGAARFFQVLFFMIGILVIVA